MQQPARYTDTALSLDDLAAMSRTELERLYRDAPAPDSLDALDGRPRGRMLAVRGTRLVSRLLRSLAAHEAFPWGGKSFATVPGERLGRGINRVRLGGIHELFGFTTAVQPSALDGRDCIALDYEQPQNPGLIQRIHDEIREVAPGLWLGPAMWKGSAGKTTLLWFALDFNNPDPRAAFALRNDEEAA